MAEVYQRSSDGLFVGSYVIGHKPDGKPIRKTVYGKTKEEAQEKLDEIKYEVRTGQYINTGKDTLIQFLRDYWNICEKNWEPTTASLYKMYIDVHFEPYFNKTRLSEIKTMTLDKFYKYKLTTERDYKVKKDGKMITKKQSPLSNNTVIKLNKFLKAAFQYAVINDKLKKNPADGVKLLSHEKYKPVVYNEDQFLKLLTRVHGTDDEIPIILGAGCGLRRGEILGLRWKDIDFDTKIITIAITEVSFDKNIEKKPKTETSSRRLIAPDYVLDILTIYKNGKNADEDDKVVTRWKPKSLSERFNYLLDKYELTHIRLHDLRHYNAVIMLKSGIPDKVAAERLGHADVSTLRQIYQHVLEEMDEEAAEKINKSISKKSQPIIEKQRELTKEEKRSKFKIVG